VITQIRLADDARGLSSVVKPRAGVAFAGLLVAGAVREVVDASPGQDGSLDETQFADVAAVTLNLRVTGQFRALLDELSQFCVPYARPYLEVSDDEWAGPRRLSMRFDSANSPIVTGSGQSRAVQLAWKVPSGCWQDSAGTEYTLTASAVFSGGFTMSATPGADVPSTGWPLHASTISADTLVVNTGTMRAPWTCKLYGPCTGPALYRDDTGEGVVFTDSLTLAAGEYVELNSADRSALFLSNPDDSRALYVDYVNTNWFDIDPGTNLIRYAPDVVSAGSVAVLDFTPRRMPV
jgi:hypothetical protein